MNFSKIRNMMCAPLQHRNVRRFCHQNGAPLAGGTAPLQSIDVPHLPGDGGPLSDLIPEQAQVHQPGDHVEFIVELAYGPVVRVCQARVALEPSDGVLHAHPGGVD